MLYVYSDGHKELIGYLIYNNNSNKDDDGIFSDVKDFCSSWGDSGPPEHEDPWGLDPADPPPVFYFPVPR